VVTPRLELGGEPPHHVERHRIERSRPGERDEAGSAAPLEPDSGFVHRT
jgi:hypothetical protein